MDRLAALLKDLNCEIVTQGFTTLKPARWTPSPSWAAISTRRCRRASKAWTATLLSRSSRRQGSEAAGAENWADLQQRMRYIARLFRCFHEEASLFEPPFSPDRCETMRMGQLPRGVL